jgi:thioredoxin-like negative regulator of GroEL
MPRKSTDNRDRNERREDALRPSPYLGYDRDTLGMHLLYREAYEIAETQFRRAMWLNPLEMQFRIHLAWCLYKQARIAEAMECLKGVQSADLDEDLRAMVALIQRAAADPTKVPRRAP